MAKDQLRFEYPLIYVAMTAKDSGEGYPRAESGGDVAFFVFTSIETAAAFAKWFGIANPLFREIANDEALDSFVSQIEKAGYTIVDFDYDNDDEIHRRATIEDIRRDIRGRMLP